MKGWLLIRLREPTTYLGIGSIFALMVCKIDGGIGHWLALGSAIGCYTLGALMPEAGDRE